MLMVNGDNFMEKEPRSPDVLVRETADSGFSRGWGFHFPPNEEYWFDCHTHLANAHSADDIRKVLKEWYAILDGYRLGRLTLLVNDIELFSACQEVQAEDDQFNWLFYQQCDQPDLQQVEQALAHGAAGLKLHNAPIMRGLVDYRIWQSEPWQRIFARIEEAGKPILWHVTQRVSRSPYHGGSENAYWSENKTSAGELNNEMLLSQFCDIVQTYQGIPFIGAHQLHVGLERLSGLLDTHPNLYIDTSCGFFLRWADMFYEQDRNAYRSFFQQYPERILFGSDARLAPGEIDTYLVESFLGHARFLLQLCLPADLLQAVASQNAERLFGLKSKEVPRRGNVRP